SAGDRDLGFPIRGRAGRTPLPCARQRPPFSVVPSGREAGGLGIGRQSLLLERQREVNGGASLSRFGLRQPDCSPCSTNVCVSADQSDPNLAGVAVTCPSLDSSGGPLSVGAAGGSYL